MEEDTNLKITQNESKLNKLKIQFKVVRSDMLKAHVDSERREKLLDLLMELGVLINKIERSVDNKIKNV